MSKKTIIMNPTAIDPSVVAEIAKDVTRHGISEEDWTRFAEAIFNVVPRGRNRDAYSLFTLLNNKTRDNRIALASRGWKTKRGPEYKNQMLVAVARLIQVAVNMGEHNFLDVDNFWGPLFEDILKKEGLTAFEKYYVNRDDPTWEKTKDAKIEVSPSVIKRGSPMNVPSKIKDYMNLPKAKTPAPLPPPIPAPPPPVPSPPPVPVPPTPDPAGWCLAGETTRLIEMRPDLQAMNDKYGHRWQEGQEVTIYSLDFSSSPPWATIKNKHGNLFTAPVTALLCFATSPGKAPPAEVPPAEAPPAEAPPAGVPAAKEDIGDVTEDLTPIDDRLDPALAKKISVLLWEVNNRFMFARKYDAGIFFATWFMRDGSCLLKGAPGTGKTTLLQLTAMALSGEEWIDDKSIVNEYGLYEWLKNHDYFGMAQYNSDKEPEDVFFYTDIAVDKREIKEEGKAERELARYIFTPTPRPIVSSFIKLHNESNRLGPNTADALLGLLAEKRVEYKGKYFTSPRTPYDTKDPPPEGRAKWESWQERAVLDSKDPRLLKVGHLNFFDYNPHLDTEGMEMDRALLDRIDVGIYLAAGGLATRYQIIKKRAEKGKISDIPKAFFLDVKDKEKNIHPLSPEEVMEIWKIVEEIPIDDEARRWIVFFTNLPNMTIRTFKPGSYFRTIPKKGKPIPTVEPMGDEYIDVTVISYKGSKAQMGFKETPRTAGSDTVEPFSTIDALNRPLGSRAALSLQNLIKASIFVSHVRSEKSIPLSFVVNDRSIKDPKAREANRARKVQMIIDHLPFVLDHRVNIGVGPDIQTNFLNFAHYIKYYFTPQIFFNEKNHEMWMKAIKVMGEIRPKTPDGKWKDTNTMIDEWLEKFMAAMGKSGEDKKDYLKELMADPFMAQLVNLAGATLE